MTIRMRLLLWFFPIFALSVTAIVIFAYINDLYQWISHTNAFSFMIVSVVGLTLGVLAAVFTVAQKISRPVQELNAAALAIAAGDYGKTIEVRGPREIQELSHTLSTMSQCMEEQIQRLQESSLARERLYGEYECSLLLQHHMMQKVVDEFINKRLSLRLIKVISSKVLNGYFFDIEQKDDSFSITVAEAKEKGFLGMYELLRDRKDYRKLNYPMTCATLNGIFTCSVERMASPIIWSTKQNTLLMAEGEVEVEPGDLIFFYNQGFAKQFQRHQLIQSWFGKVLRHFASENFDSFAMVLTNELNFLANKQHIPDDMYILCLRLEK